MSMKSRQILSEILICVIIALIIPLNANAQSDFEPYERNGYTYAMYYGNSRLVRVPDYVNALRSMQFAMDDDIEGVIVPSSVRRIDDHAFWKCKNLKYICFEDDCDIMGENVISFCPNLKNISAPTGSLQYKYAQSNNIPVTDKVTTGFKKKTIYLIKGDKVHQDLLNNIEEITWSSSNEGIAKVNDNGDVKAKKVGKATIYAYVKGKIYKFKVVVYSKNETNRVTQIKKNEISKGMSKEQKIRAAHDWLLENCRYDRENYNRGTIPTVSFSSYGALIKKTAVCQGYACGFKKIMDSLGIPCLVVSGKVGREGHAWNMVKLGEKWYHVDCTWDDSTETDLNGKALKKYTWYLKSTSYVLRMGHQFSYKNYPTCSSTKYDNKTKF